MKWLGGDGTNIYLKKNTQNEGLSFDRSFGTSQDFNPLKTTYTPISTPQPDRQDIPSQRELTSKHYLCTYIDALRFFVCSVYLRQTCLPLLIFRGRAALFWWNYRGGDTVKSSSVFSIVRPQMCGVPGAIAISTKWVLLRYVEIYLTVSSIKPCLQIWYKSIVCYSSDPYSRDSLHSSAKGDLSHLLISSFPMFCNSAV